MQTKIKIGVFGIGLYTYWAQFKGLEDRLTGYLNEIAARLTKYDVSVFNGGLVDTVDRARTAGETFRREDVSVIFLYVSTYALSATVLPVVQRAGVPVIVLNLQPSAAIDYAWFNSLEDRGEMTGEWLANCQACAVPEIANVFNRAKVQFHLVTGTLHDAEAWNEIEGWVQAAKVVKGMQENRLGLLGHYYNGMLDIYTDLTLQLSVFGGHLQHIEMDDLKVFQDAVTRAETENKILRMKEQFTVVDECSDAELMRGARTAVALDKLVDHFALGSLCYYYEGKEGNAYEDIIASVIAGNSMLTAKGIPVAGEYEVKNVQAMKIMDLFGAGGSFSEFYGMDFNDGIILMGHDGPGHLAIAEDKPVLKPLGVYHGKPGKGLSVEMKVKEGPVTLLSVAETIDGKLKLVMAEGASVSGPILQIGNTNSRYRFSLDIKTFMDRWCNEAPAHHCAIGVGHIGHKLQKLAALLGIEAVKVC
jgi:L-arabinose isomerase